MVLASAAYDRRPSRCSSSMIRLPTSSIPLPSGKASSRRPPRLQADGEHGTARRGPSGARGHAHDDAPVSHLPTRATVIAARRRRCKCFHHVTCLSLRIHEYAAPSAPGRRGGGPGAGARRRRRRRRRGGGPDRRAPGVPAGRGARRRRPRPGRAGRGGHRRPAVQRRRRGRLGSRGAARADHRHPRRRGAQRHRPALRPAGLHRLPARRRDLPGHGHVAVPPAPAAPVRADRRQARRRAVRAGRRVGGARRAGPGRDGRRAGPVRRVRPVRRRPPVRLDRRGRRPGRRRPGRRRLRLRAHFLDLDHDRGVPQPAGRLGARPRLVHHRAVRRAGGLRLPGGHRPGRVRARRARGGAARAALGGRPAGHLQVRPRRRVHRRAAARCTGSGWTGTEPVDVRGTRVSPRDVVAACLPDPAGAGRPDARADLRRHPRHRDRPDGAAREVYLYQVADNERVDGARRRPGRGLADRGQPGGRRWS